MLFSKAIDGFILSKQIAGLSHTTLLMYRYHLEHFVSYNNDTELTKVTPDDIKRFLFWLQTEYQPVRWNKTDDSPLAARTIKNVWIVFKSFYTWAKDELGTPDVMVNIPPPKAADVEVDPFSQGEIKSLLKVVDRKTNGDKSPYADRNRSIILMLLDTGIRATELCMLCIVDCDIKTGKLRIEQGKGNKKRVVHLGATTRKALWKYFSTRGELDPAAPLFLGQNNKHLKRTYLRQLLDRLGDKAGIKDCYPHRFRHTFAIEYLRNGGDIFTLQMLLGHSSLEMVRYYSKVAQVDTERVHRRAGPVDNWL